MIRNNARCTREINSSIAMTKAAIKIRNTFQQQIVRNFLEGTNNTAAFAASDFYGAEHCTLLKADQNNWRVLNCGVRGGR
jgi:hypothetical protein